MSCTLVGDNRVFLSALKAVAPGSYFLKRASVSSGLRFPTGRMVLEDDATLREWIFVKRQALVTSVAQRSFSDADDLSQSGRLL